MEVTDTIYRIDDSISVVSHHIVNESHNLTGYMTDSINGLYKPFITPPFEHQDWSVVSNLGVKSAIIIGISIVIIAFLHWLFRDSKKLKNILSNFASEWTFLFVWLYGFIVYDVGMCTGEYISLLTNAPMAIIYAFKIFIFDSDVSEIHNVFHESWVYSLNFAFVHFLAAIISTTFIIKHFGFNVVARLRIWWLSIRQYWGFCKTKDLYIFWGLNDASCLMANSIEEHYKSKKDFNKKDYKTIIIRVPREDDKDEEDQKVFDRLFNILSIKGSDIEKLQRLDCYTAVTNVNLSSINPKQFNDSSSEVIRDVLKLKSLRRIIKYGVTGKIHILALSDDEKANLKLTSLLANDTLIRKRANDLASSWNEVYQATKLRCRLMSILEFGYNKCATILKIKKKQSKCRDKQYDAFGATIYCHARYNSVHRVIEDNMVQSGLQIKVIDSSHLSVELLKQDKNHLPVNFVNVESDGRVSSPFNSLVVGFSEVGQDSVRFLYEFGAFVGADSPEGMALRSKFHMDVVDCEMKNLAGTFIANAPAINPCLSYDKNSNNREALISLHNMNCNSPEFYEMLINKIKTLNYVVIATENDELNISLGVRIFKLAMRYRENMKNFCILVRAHNDEDGHLTKITQYYNRLLAAHGENFDTTRRTSTLIRRNAELKLPLFIFGNDKKVYTYDNIIDDVIERNAAMYKEEYYVASGDKKEVSTDPSKMSWYTEYIELMQLDEKHKEYSPTYGGIMRLRRTRGQDIENCLHKLTKECIVAKATEAAKNAGLQHDVTWDNYSRIPKQIKYFKDGEVADDYATTLLEVLAQMEHLRWNAAHEIWGYTRDGEVNEKDEVRLTHSCLRDYHEFKTDNPKHIEVLSYDKSVVDLTLGVKRANINYNTSK